MMDNRRVNLGELFEDVEIFITGGSGVVGKAFIECMLRLCNVRCIYILLRPKRNATVEERLEKICNNMIFDRLKTEKPNEFKKLIPIAGDVLLPNLGVTPDVVEKIQNVSFMYHCAATVRFDEPLKAALKLNVGGTLEAIKLAKTLKNLKLFMHVSTFFSNPYVIDVEQKVYQSPMDWKFCLNLVKQDYNEDIIDCLTKKLITGFPNTYTFTKHLAESLVNDHRHELPLVIVRPSVVLFSLLNPVPGFPTSLNGAMGLFAVAGAGLLKTVFIGDDVLLDITPQDFCVHLMAFYTHKTIEYYKHKPLAPMPVYNFSSYHFQSQPFKDLAESMDNIWYTKSFEKCLLIPSVIYTSNRFVYKLVTFVKQLPVAMLVDGILKLCGRKPELMPIMRKIFITQEVMQSFMFNNYTSKNTNYDDFFELTRGTQFSMEGCIRESIKDTIGMNTRMIEGIKKYSLKEDINEIPKCQRIHNIKYVIYQLIRAYFYYKLLTWLYRTMFSKYF